MTPDRLNDHVKRVSGVTAGHLIRQRVLTEAKRALVFTGQPIHEMSYDLGFADPSHFARFFRKQTGDDAAGIPRGQGRLIRGYFGRGSRRRRVRLLQLAAPHHLHRLHQRARGVARFLLHAVILVERVVAGGIGLHVADVAAELRLMAGLDQAHVGEPAVQSARAPPRRRPRRRAPRRENTRPARWRG